MKNVFNYNNEVYNTPDLLMSLLKQYSYSRYYPYVSYIYRKLNNIQFN